MDPDHEALLAERALIRTVGVDRQVERRRASEAALQYERTGWKIVLLRHGTKAALFKAWQERDPLTRFEILRHTGRPVNLGFDLRRSGVLVIDKDAASMPAYRLMQKHGLRSEMEIETSRGVHVYFKLPAALKGFKSVQGFRGLPLDFKTTGYCLVPPSWNAKDSWRYQARKGKRILTPDLLEEPRPSFVDLLLESRKPEPPPRVFELPAGAKLEAMRRWIRRVRAVEGSGGDKNTFRVAVKIVSVVKDFDAALAEILAWNSEGHATPPWSEKELVHKIRSALKYAVNGR